jgi:deazaflavin-dependent oxidoreductase (nitroreductase family)
MGVMTGITVAAYHLLGDRMRVMGQPLLLLATVGARSGKARQTLLCRFPDEPLEAGRDAVDRTWLVVASGAGSARHPARFLNVARHPDQVWVEIAKRRRHVRPESLTGVERARAWRRIVALAPGYAAYQEQTDREIPVIRLRPLA